MNNVSENNVFQVGGTLSPDSPVYIHRQADTDLYNCLKEGHYCSILNSRQMGKSSLLLNVKRKLQSDGVIGVLLDFSRIGSSNISPEQWYAGIVSEIAKHIDLGNDFDLNDWWFQLGELSASQKLGVFLETIVFELPAKSKVIIFIDEIDSVLSLPFSVDDFFLLVRHCFNSRANDIRYQKLTFAFFGVASPNDLIADKMASPFNIGKNILLNGFSHEEASPFLVGLKNLDLCEKSLLAAVIDWTGGQPFLTQKLCQLLVREADESEEKFNSEHYFVGSLVQKYIVDNWQENDNPEHLRTIRDRLLLDSQNVTHTLRLYKKVLESSNTRIKADQQENFSRLFLTGLINVNNLNVTVRNKIYRLVFNACWVDKQLARISPYEKSLRTWVESGQLDDSCLLNEHELDSAKQWSSEKVLSDIDYRYIAASEQKVRKDAVYINEQLRVEVEKRKNIEARLQNALLELHEAKADAEYANKAKTEFLSRVSYEVRTPLSAVLGFSHLAQDLSNDDLVSGYIDKISRAAGHLQGVITDIVDFEHIEKGELALHSDRFLFDDVVDNVLGVIGFECWKQKTCFQLDLPADPVPPLVGDQLRIEQVLINLLQDALFSSVGGKLQLSFTTTKHQSGRLLLGVSIKAINTNDHSMSACHDSYLQEKTSSTAVFLSRHILDLMGSELYFYDHGNLSRTAQFSIDLKCCFPESTPPDLAGLRLGLLCPQVITQATLASQFERLSAKVDILNHLQDIDQYDLIVADARYLSLADNNYADHTLSNLVLPVVDLGSRSDGVFSGVNYQNIIEFPLSDTRLAKVINSMVIQPASANSPVNQSMPDHNQNSLHILVADDNELNLQIMSELLIRWVEKVDLVTNGKEALDNVENNNYDLIFMDMEMPVLSGLEATQAIRHLDDKHKSQVTIIAMTANILPSDKQRCLAAGMDDYVSKPFQPEVIEKILSRYLSKHIQLKSQSFSSTENCYKALVDIDTDFGLKVVSGNHVLYRNLLIKFKRANENFLAQFMKMVDSSSADQVTERTRLAHSLKGVAANIGAKSVEESANRLEQACLNKRDTSYLIQLAEIVHVQLSKVFDQIHDFEQKTNSQDLPPENSENFSSLFDDLYLLLVNSDASAKLLFNEHSVLFRKNIPFAVYNNLENAIHDYRFDVAVNLFEKIMIEKEKIKDKEVSE